MGHFFWPKINSDFFAKSVKFFWAVRIFKENSYFAQGWIK